MEAEKSSKYGLIDQLKIIEKRLDTYIKEDSAIVAGLDGKIKSLREDYVSSTKWISNHQFEKRIKELEDLTANLSIEASYVKSELPPEPKKSKLRQILDIFR